MVVCALRDRETVVDRKRVGAIHPRTQHTESGLNMSENANSYGPDRDITLTGQERVNLMLLVQKESKNIISAMGDVERHVGPVQDMQALVRYNNLLNSILEKLS